MAQAYLAHLHPDFKFGCKNFYQFAKVNPVIGRVVKSSFGVIGLVLYVRELHFQVQLADDFACTVQGGHLPVLCFGHLFQIAGGGKAVNLFYFCIIGYLFLLHLQAYQLALQRYMTNMMTGGHFYNHRIACV